MAQSEAVHFIMSDTCHVATYPRVCFFIVNDTATSDIYTLSLHDALPILRRTKGVLVIGLLIGVAAAGGGFVAAATPISSRSEEHTSELQSRQYLVCRLLLEKKK